MPLIPGRGRQSYLSSRTAQAIKRDSVSREKEKKKKKNRLTFTSGTQYKNIPTYSNPAGNCLPLLSPPIATDLVSVQTPTHPV